MAINKFASQFTGSLLLLSLCAPAVLAAPGSIAVDTAGKKKLAVTPKLSDTTPNLAARPHMDLAFCIDTTGSMQNEIDMVKTKTRDMVAKLSVGKPTPIIRIGLVAYRDKGDEYVTKVFPFTSDIDKVVKDISSLKADGGGDAPEAVDQGLHAALTELQWASDTRTAKLLFLIGDAGPHGTKTDLDWKQDCRNAIGRGIQINTMGCQGLDKQPLEVFKEIAKLTDGKFESLAYRQEVVDAEGRRTSLIYSGDSFYRISSKASGAGDWKTAVSRGMVKKVSAPATAGGVLGETEVAAETMAGGRGGGAKDLPATTSASASPMSAPSARSSRSAYGSFSSMSVQRKDNNLDELMLDAARKRASNSLKVTY